MHKLREMQYAVARPIFVELADFNVSVDAVLAGTAPGEVWVDDINSPRVGLVITSPGHYLAGDVSQASCYPALRETIPSQGFLIFYPAGWEKVLDKIWSNPVARRHARKHMLWQRQHIADWRNLVPHRFQLVPVDPALLDRTNLRNHAAIAAWVAGWHSTKYFLQYGFGFCLLYDDTIASWCIADCANGHKCEMGVATDSDFRRQGLATIVIAAAVEHGLAKGFTHIGWHCFSSNTGSIAVAKKVGFAEAREYFAHSPRLPAKNAPDLAPVEYAEWAQHYEDAVESNIRYAFDAAEAWALADNADRALSNLQLLVDKGREVRPEWLTNNWRFASIQETPEFEGLVVQLRRKASDAV